MPFVIYVFTISAFALGLAEFVPIGLTDVMAQGLCVGVEQTGAAVTTYALGATFAAPVLSALTASWSRKNVMLTTAVVFTAGSLAAAFAATLPQLLLARFIAGLGHGLFLAAASVPQLVLLDRVKQAERWLWYLVALLWRWQSAYR